MERLSSWNDIQEESFFKCLREIEKSYIHLPKTLRIRTEKWVEKLVGTCSNITWRKHRNAYSRLLLNMVVSKSFSEPFHCLPPDGPLPSFPAHVKAYQKDLLGPHETRFWRNLYEHANELAKENPPYSEPSHQQSSLDSAAMKEIRNLNLLVRDQAQRIQLLEQQIKDERAKYELEIQRLHFAHRMEMVKIADAPVTVTTPPRDVSRNAAANDFSQPLPAPLPSFISSHDSMPAPQVTRSPYTGRAYDTRIRSSERSQHQWASDVSQPSQSVFPAGDRSQPPSVSSSVASHHSRSSKVATFPVAPPSAMAMPSFLMAADQASSLETPRADPMDIRPHSLSKPFLETLSASSPSPVKDILPKPRPAVDILGAASLQASVSSSSEEHDDEDFLNYVDRFQSEMKRMQQQMETLSAATSSV